MTTRMTNMIKRYLPGRFRPRKRAVTLPCTLRRKRIYILPTRHGILFIVVLSGMLLGSVNYNNNLGFLLTFLLGSMAFVSILHTHRNLSGVRIVSVTPTPAFAGENAVFRVHVQVATSDRSAVVFRFTDIDGVRRDIKSGLDNAVAVTVPARQRGLLRPGPLIVSTRYPLGLFRAWSPLPLEMTCPVYPRPIQGPLATGEGLSADDKEAGTPRGRGVEDFQGLKSYQPGDLMQHISWKAFSKGQGLLTKEFVGQSGTSVLLDWDAVSETDTERKLSRLCGMVLKASGLDMTYGLNLPGQTIPLDKGEAHKHTCLRALAFFGTPGEAS